MITTMITAATMIVQVISDRASPAFADGDGDMELRVDIEGDDEGEVEGGLEPEDEPEQVVPEEDCSAQLTYQFKLPK